MKNFQVWLTLYWLYKNLSKGHTVLFYLQSYYLTIYTKTKLWIVNLLHVSYAISYLGILS